MEEFCALQSLCFRRLPAGFLLSGVYIGMRGRNHEKVYIFNKNLDRLVTKVDPVEGEREGSKMSCTWR